LFPSVVGSPVVHTQSYVRNLPGKGPHANMADT
jgi:hypothetical protein